MLSFKIISIRQRKIFLLRNIKMRPHQQNSSHKIAKTVHIMDRHGSIDFRVYKFYYCVCEHYGEGEHQENEILFTKFQVVVDLVQGVGMVEAP